MPPPHSLLRVALPMMAACMILSGHARADIYGYIDSNGIGHFASERADPRYELFLKGGGQSANQAKLTEPLPLVDADTQDRLAESTAYRSLLEHPNLKKYQRIVEEAAEEHSLNPALLKAVIAAESSFNPNAVSPKGAVGLMQIMPSTAQWLGLKPDRKRSVAKKLTDPKTNVRLGARYLKMLMERFPGNLELVLAAYNAGEGSVIRHNHTVPPFPETRNYVQVVSQLHDLYQPRPLLADTARGEGKRLSLILPGQEDAPQSSGQ